MYERAVRFDARLERSEYERLFAHAARVLQDRLVRRSKTDRTRHHAFSDWEKLEHEEVVTLKLLQQARVLGWGKEKRYYYSRLDSA